jgi:uncharacterized protein YjiS (DUF1127 family)
MPRTATFNPEQTRSPSVAALAVVQHVFSQVVRSWARRRQLAHIAELDDRLLADIGLTREDVNSALPFSVRKSRATSQLAAAQSRRG